MATKKAVKKAAAKSAAAPKKSAAPQPKPAKSAAVKQPAPAKQEKEPASRPLVEFPDLVDVLPVLCGEYRDLVEQISELEARKKELGASIMPLLEDAGCDSIAGDGWVANRVRGTSSKLMPELLLQNGVRMEIIEKSTKKSHYWYVQVRKAVEAQG